MLIMTANSAMDAVFHRIIKVMGQNVTWDGRLVFNNNTLILPGALKSLFFSFDNRKIIGTVIEGELSKDVIPMPSDKIMENSVNLVLYVFGKWNLLKGITVKHDYSQINSIFNGVFDEIAVTVEATEENCRFYKDGIRITYEEVIELVLEYLQPEAADELSDESDGQGADVELEDTHKIGLWHKILWKSRDITFSKGITTLEQRKQSRMGMHFYCTGYKCPVCSDSLHMTVYPEGSEETIDTDEGAVVAARVYTCPKCVMFYTPRPDRLLVDGEVYVMDFEEDTVAYSDYLELLSKNGDRTCNGNFNRYLSDAPESSDGDVLDRLKDIFANVNEASDDEILEAWEQTDSAMISEGEAAQFENKLHREVKKRKLEKKLGERRPAANEKGRADGREVASKEKSSEAARKAGANSDKAQGSQKSAASIADKAQNSQRGAASNMSKAQDSQKKAASNSNNAVLSEAVGDADAADEKQSSAGTDGGDNTLTDGMNHGSVHENAEKIPEASLKDILSEVSGKSYSDIAAAYERVKKGSYPEEEKTSALESLMKLMNAAGKREMDSLAGAFPDRPTTEQYNAFKDRLEAYSGIDNSAWVSRLDEKRDAVELSELAEYVRKNNRRPKDRKSLVALADAVGKLDYLERNKKIVMDEILEPVRRYDEAKADSICDKLMDCDYDDSLDAYHNVFKGDFLPDIKENALERIIRRLEGIKKDECRSLIGKLVRDTGFKEGDIQGVYVYDVARMWKKECDDADAIIFHNANYCFAPLAPFEYPLLVYDSTRGNDGKKGFLLTPDAIYYRSGGESGRIGVSDIGKLYVKGGLFGKGVYAENSRGEYKIAGRLKDKEKLEAYAGRLSRFIDYLKEKPASRNAEYLIREKHEIKCCLRCGHVYGVGNVCPKCGNAEFN